MSILTIKLLKTLCVHHFFSSWTVVMPSFNCSVFIPGTKYEGPSKWSKSYDDHNKGHASCVICFVVNHQFKVLFTKNVCTSPGVSGIKKGFGTLSGKYLNIHIKKHPCIKMCLQEKISKKGQDILMEDTSMVCKTLQYICEGKKDINEVILHEAHFFSTKLPKSAKYTYLKISTINFCFILCYQHIRTIITENMLKYLLSFLQLHFSLLLQRSV